MHLLIYSLILFYQQSSADRDPPLSVSLYRLTTGVTSVGGDGAQGPDLCGVYTGNNNNTSCTGHGAVIHCHGCIATVLLVVQLDQESRHI